ncbi:MAG: orotate phosphoribosyltransferase [Coriobacteriales bacterium]|jgi:orotate phosphoribosyltransferase|nr:orotate phosphoribosyltransferase [Coriobacteriales bacterium]
MVQRMGASEYRELLRPLVEEALVLKPTKLASGVMSNFYFDGKLVTLHPAGAYHLARYLLEHIPSDEYDAIGGLTMGADPIASAVAAVSYEVGSPKTAFYVRKTQKDHGRCKRIEGPLAKGSRVLIVDDVATSGGSILDSIHAVEDELDCTVTRVVALVDRQQGARELFESQGYVFDPVFTAEELGVPIETIRVPLSLSATDEASGTLDSVDSVRADWGDW